MNLHEKLAALGRWYHKIELPDGTFTPGHANIQYKFNIIEPYLPSNLSGARVLDLGCNSGGFSFELAKRGASVVGVEKTAHYFKQALFLQSVFNLDVQFYNLTIYEIKKLGVFDYVLFLGLLYHLRYPMLALDLVHSCCKEQVFVSQKTSLAEDVSMELVNSQRNFISEKKEATENWWFTSKDCTTAMMQLAGFTNVKTIYFDKKGQNIWLTAKSSLEKIQLPSEYR